MKSTREPFLAHPPEDRLPVEAPRELEAEALGCERQRGGRVRAVGDPFAGAELVRRVIVVFRDEIGAAIVAGRRRAKQQRQKIDQRMVAGDEKNFSPCDSRDSSSSSAAHRQDAGRLSCSARRHNDACTAAPAGAALHRGHAVAVHIPRRIADQDQPRRAFAEHIAATSQARTARCRTWRRSTTRPSSQRRSGGNPHVAAGWPARGRRQARRRPRRGGGAGARAALPGRPAVLGFKEVRFGRGRERLQTFSRDVTFPSKLCARPKISHSDVT